MDVPVWASRREPSAASQALPVALKGPEAMPPREAYRAFPGSGAEPRNEIIDVKGNNGAYLLPQSGDGYGTGMTSPQFLQVRNSSLAKKFWYAFETGSSR